MTPTGFCYDLAKQKAQRTFIRWAFFALSSATAPQLFESTLGYALKSFGQKKNSSIFTILEFLVERSNPNPNHCPLGHLWRRFHRK